MKIRFFSREHTQTAYVKIDMRKCEACWKCLGSCPSQVIDKIDLPWHKHALIIKQDACTGCMNCFNICQNGAYSVVDGVKQEVEKHRQHILNSFIVNNLLLLISLAMIVSGLVMQLGFHVGEQGQHQGNEQVVQSRTLSYEQMRGIDPLGTVWGISYTNWSIIHKYAIVAFSILIIYHTYAHWSWYKRVISKQLFGKNRLVITLSLLFLLVAVTGFIPWIIDLLGSKSILRLILIELHDKLALVLVVCLILHLIKRNRWFVATYAKLRE